MSVYSVSLPGPGPYGFRLQGGKDFNTPLTIARLNDGGKAAQALIGIGDKVLSIDGIKADGITHLDAQNMIKACTGNLNMTLQKASAAPSTPQKVQKETAVTKQNPVKRPPRKHIVDTYTDIYHIPSHTEDSKTRLMDNTEDWHPRTGTTQSRSFRILAQITGTENLAEADPDNTKKTNTFAEVSNGLDAQMPSNPATQSVSTQTSVHQEAAETPLTPETAVSPRKQLFENPLEALPKGAPYPPPLIQVLKLDHHVATVTKIATSLTRSRKPVRDPAFLTAGPDVPSMMTNGAGNQSFADLKCTVATQTSESADHPLSSPGSPCAVRTQTPTTPERCPSDRHFSVPPSAEKASPVTETPGYRVISAGSNFSKSKLMENPLESLPKSSPIPAPSVSLPNLSPVDRASAVATVSAAVGAQARLFDPSPYRALLDALLITPITKPSLPYQQHTRKSTSAIHRMGDISDTLEPVNSGAYAAAISKSMPKGSENANKPAFAQTASTAFSRPSAPMGTVKSTGWQPISKATPSTGRISNASPHAGTAPNNKKPWTQPQPSEQDTLVQKAEHIPAGTRTPMCAHCDMVIRGPFLLALGKSWHPEEFNCAHCKKSMADSGFVQEKGALYCDLCYGKFFAPECARCHRKILGEVINALKQTWHVTCFVCVACGQPIRSSTFHMEDGEPYCETDYYSLFGTMCHGCEFPIEAGDRFLDALGSTWHDTCFVCTVCCESLEGQTFFSKKDKPLCKKHAHSVNM